LKGLKVRVQGAPIWSRTFAATGMSPTVIAYNEVYNAIQNGVIAAGENEAAGVEQMKFFEVAPHLSMTQHAITIRPLCFSTKTFKKLDPALQAAVLRAGKEAGAYGRQVESSEDEQKLVAMEKAGKLKRVPFTERAQLKALVDPVMAAYAKEIDADAILAKINAIKWLMVGTVAVLIVPVTLQIISRYTALIPSWIWTEELSRFLFIWMVMLGAMIGIREHTHFEVDVWPELRPKAAALLRIVSHLFVLVFALVFVWWGIEFVRFGWDQTSELAELPMTFIFMAWPVAGVTWVLFLGEAFVASLRVLMGKTDR
jgi:TRAP-type C4-dicarboxylate transport system permease small subunit